MRTGDTRASFLLYGLFVVGAIVYSYLTGGLSVLLAGHQILKIILLMLLFLASPFLCFRYYRMPIWVKLPILLAEAGKYFLLTFLMTTWVMPYTYVSPDTVQQNMIRFLNKTLETSTERFAASAGTFSTVLGVITGGVYLLFSCIRRADSGPFDPGDGVSSCSNAPVRYDKLIHMFVLGQAADR
jgi:hypothetical protein